MKTGFFAVSKKFIPKKQGFVPNLFTMQLMSDTLREGSGDMGDGKEVKR